MWKDWWEKYDGFDFYIKMEKYLLEELKYMFLLYIKKKRKK